MAKVPGLDRDGIRLRKVPLNIAMPDAFIGTQRRIAYERLLLDLIEGDQTLFVRRDEVEAQWNWIDAIRANWTNEGLLPKTYTAGSSGPERRDCADRARRSDAGMSKPLHPAIARVTRRVEEQVEGLRAAPIST